jgi:hypothetical protein
MGRALDNAMLNVGQKDVATSMFSLRNPVLQQILTVFRGPR